MIWALVAFAIWFVLAVCALIVVSVPTYDEISEACDADFAAWERESWS